LIILDISQSSYIFKQQIIIEIIEIIICCGLTAVLLIQLNKKLRTTSSRFQEMGWTILGVLLTLAIYFTFFFPSIKKTLALKNSGVEMIGKTVQWINTNDSRMIEYSFILNGQTFKKTCDAVYGGQEVPGIVCPDGKYVVIYDIEDPDNSIMDFNLPSK
jgi:hypothetical protein